MKIEHTALSDLILITLRRFGYHLGYFAETYSERAHAELGIDASFVQDNQ